MSLLLRVLTRYVGFSCTLYVNESSDADDEDMDAMMTRADESSESTDPLLISPLAPILAFNSGLPNTLCLTR